MSSPVFASPWKPPIRHGVVALGFFLAVLTVPGRRASADEAQTTGHLRIGVLAHQDTNEGLSSVDRALIGLRKGAGLKEPFAVARGTYADLLHWLETGAVDLAVVSPAILGRALELGGGVRWEYLATVRTPTDPSPSLSVAVVPEQSQIHTAEDLRTRIVRGEVRLVFVDPLSVSGALAPRVALAAASIPVPENRIRYTHSHINSLRRAPHGRFERRGRIRVERHARRASDGGTPKGRVADPGQAPGPSGRPDCSLEYPAAQPTQGRGECSSCAPDPALPAQRAGAYFVADPAWRDTDATVRAWLAAAGARGRTGSCGWISKSSATSSFITRARSRSRYAWLWFSPVVARNARIRSVRCARSRRSSHG